MTEPTSEKLTDIVLCLVCGLQHSGSTMLGELLRAAPGVEGRFEAGLMAFDNFEQHRASPFRRFLLDFWKLSSEQIEEVYAADSLRDAYLKLREYSGFEGERIVDKAPRCALRLAEILKQCDLPVLFTVRDPRAVLYSARKHVEWPVRNFADHYHNYVDTLVRARANFPGRILVVQYENFCKSPASEGQRIYSFLGLDWNPEYLNLDHADPNVGGKVQGGVSTGFLNEYRDHVSEADQAQLLEMLGEYSEFFEPATA